MTIADRLMLAAAGLLTASTAFAQDASPPVWLVHAGVSRLSFIDKASVQAAGNHVDGGGVHSKAQYTASFDVARFVTRTVAINLAAGIPPTVRMDGAGSLAPLGRLVKATYASPALTILWEPVASRAVSPYLGAGVTYMHVLKTRDRALRQARIDDDLGPVLQGGVTVTATGGWGVFADLKKGFVRTRARGTVGGLPIDARIKMDPLVMQTGLSLRL
jgi:outer membrane protein